MRLPHPAGWPLAGQHRVARAFDPPPQPWLPGHRGTDLVGSAGQPIRSAAAGTVSFVGTVGGRPLVSVEHPGGWRTTYEPVRGTVKAGQPVAVGTILGLLQDGHPRCPEPACLHWGLRTGDRYLDPLTLLGGGRVRLFPLTGADEQPVPHLG